VFVAVEQLLAVAGRVEVRCHRSGIGDDVPTGQVLGAQPPDPGAQLVNPSTGPPERALVASASIWST
jgi:hypothetical protein